MKLYIKLVRIFRRAGVAFGFAMCVFMVYATNWTVGLAYGIFSGALLAFGVPLILLIAGRKQRALRKGESLAEH